MAPFDLSACLEAVRQDDQEAARLLIEQLHPQVIRIVRSHLPRRMAEEDLAQEIFVKLFDRLPQYVERPGIPFEHWLSRLAVRTCLDALRAERRRPEWRHADLSEDELTWLEHLVSDNTDPPAASAIGARDLVHKLLGDLSPADRLVITLLDLEQKSVKEISTLTGWSVALVKVRAFRARRKLRRLAAVLEQETAHA